MTWTGFFWGLGDLLDATFTILRSDMIGNIFNYSLIVLGFVGLFYWLKKQKEFNQQAENDPNQIK